MNEERNELHVVLGTRPAGSTLVNHLADKGVRVRSVDRRGNGPDRPNVEKIQADLTDPQEAIAATVGANVVYHCANVAYHLQVDLLPHIATSILAAAEANNARLVVLDTLYPYGAAEGEHITEETPWAATSRKGMLRAELDSRYVKSQEEGRERMTLGRSADFFGPGVLNSTLGGAFFPPALTGETVLEIGNIELPHSYSFIPDIARGLVALGETDGGDGRVWHLPTVPAVPTFEIHRIVEDILGRRLEVNVLKKARAFGPFDQTFMDGYAEMFYQHEMPQNMVSAAFEREFDLHSTPLRAALEQTLDWYRAFLTEQQAA